MCKSYHPTDREPYMCTAQVEFFRERLTSWRKQLNTEIRRSRQRILENEQPSGDILDQSVNDNHRTMDFLSRNRLEQQIKQIDAALIRLSEGNFGYCLESGEEIGLKRLLAYPIATLSVEAQELVERRQRTHQAA